MSISEMNSQFDNFKYFVNLLPATSYTINKDLFLDIKKICCQHLG